MIGSAPSCAMDIQTLSYRRMGLEAAALLNFSQPFFVSQERNCSGGMYISYSVVPKKKEDLVVCFLDWRKDGWQFLSVHPDGGRSALGFSNADGFGDKSSFITTELHQLPVYGEQ
jgi:hypothetical protein